METVPFFPVTLPWGCARGPQRGAGEAVPTEALKCVFTVLGARKKCVPRQLQEVP